MGKKHWQRGRAFAFAGLVCLVAAASGRAEEKCALMNAATAGGILGGKVTGVTTNSVTDKKTGEVVRSGCAFELQRDGVVSRLTVEVIAMQAPQSDFAVFTAQCGSGASPLKAIGNEAVACGGIDHAERWESVVGRVRDQAFTVRLSSNDPSAQSDRLREKTRKTAEFLASNLF